MHPPVNPRILQFIAEHHVLTLAVSRNDIPWCAHCFYSYLPPRNLFVFTSEADTRHIRDVELSGNNLVAAGVSLETKMVWKIRGLQILGKMRHLEGAELKDARRAYLSDFPVARLAPLDLWGVEAVHMKLTDNRLGFGKKLIWNLEHV
jgi:uncharacterized protein YhbP (UPF0306 family)